MQISQGQGFSQTRAGDSSDDDEMNDTDKNCVGETVTPQKVSQPPSRMSDGDEIESGKAAPKSTKRPTCQKVPAKFAKKRREDRELEILEELTKSLNEPASENTQSDISEIDSFCQYISKSLNKFDEKTKNIVKNGIQNLIFQAEMGNAITPMLGSVMPVAPQHVYHRPVPSTSSEHNPLYEAIHDSANIYW